MEGMDCRLKFFTNVANDRIYARYSRHEVKKSTNDNKAGELDRAPLNER